MSLETSTCWPMNDIKSKHYYINFHQMSNFFRKLWNSREFVWQFKLITKPLRLGLQQKNWLSVNWSPVNWLELTIQIKKIQEDLFTIIEKLFINRLTLEFQDGRRMVELLCAIISIPLSKYVISLFQWMSVEQGNCRIITCFASTSTKTKEDNCFAW